MVTLRGFGAASGPGWIGSRSPAVVGGRLQRGWPVGSVAPQVLQLFQPPLQLGDHAAQLPGLEPGDVQLLQGLAGDGGPLPISVLLICTSRSKHQIFLLRYTIRRRMSSGTSAPGGASGGSLPGGPPGGPLPGGPRLGGPPGGPPPCGPPGCPPPGGPGGRPPRGPPLPDGSASGPNPMLSSMFMSPHRVQISAGVGRGCRTLSTQTPRGVVASSAAVSGRFHLAARELVAMPAVLSIPIAAGDEGVGVMGVPLGRPPWSFRSLPPALEAGTGGGAATLAAPRVLCVQVDHHPGGGVPVEEPPDRVHLGPSRGPLAADLPLGLLHGRGYCLRGTPLGLLVGTSGLPLPLLLQPGLPRLQGPELRLGLGLILGNLPSRGLAGLPLRGVRLGLHPRLFSCPLLG